MEDEEKVSKSRYIATEPINFLILAIHGMLSTLRTLYVRDVLAREYQYSLMPQQIGNCSLLNVSDPLEVKINSETALWVMWFSSLSYFPSIITAPVLIASSDFIGRKPVLIFSAVGHLVATLIFLMTSAIESPLAVTLLAFITLGLCGDATTTTSVSSAYIADSTKDHSRTQRLVVQTFSTYGGWGLGQALGGILMQYLDNYFVCFAVPVILSVLNLAYLACPGMLPETIPARVDMSTRKVLTKSFRNLLDIFRKVESGGRWVVWCIMAISCVHMLVNDALYDAIVIYGLGRPFCWTPEIVGYYNAAVSLFPACVAAVIVKPLLKCFSAYWLLHFSLLSFIAQILTSALATNTVQLAIVATAVSFLRTSVSPLCRDLLSKAVTKEEHGTTFAVLSFTLSLVSLCSPIFINGLFSKALKMGFPQLTFYVTSVILIIPMVLNGILQCNQRSSSYNRPLSPSTVDQEEVVLDSD